MEKKIITERNGSDGCLCVNVLWWKRSFTSTTLTIRMPVKRVWQKHFMFASTLSWLIAFFFLHTSGFGISSLCAYCSASTQPSIIDFLADESLLQTNQHVGDTQSQRERKKPLTFFFFLSVLFFAFCVPSDIPSQRGGMGWRGGAGEAAEGRAKENRDTQTQEVRCS